MLNAPNESRKLAYALAYASDNKDKDIVIEIREKQEYKKLNDKCKKYVDNVWNRK